MDEYDYVVVGGGSAGCIVAAELANDPSKRVLLLEGGPSAEEHPETLIASGYKQAFINDAVMGERFSVPQVHSAQQRIFAGTGTVMGGSGSVNGMVYTRGSREDYTEWPEGWHWEDNLADFAAIEETLRPHRRPAHPSGRKPASRRPKKTDSTRKEDLNDGNMSNVIGYEWMSYEGDDRRSSYVAFIKDAGTAENLTLLSGARAHQGRVFTARKRARAVEFQHEGELKRASARA